MLAGGLTDDDIGTPETGMREAGPGTELGTTDGRLEGFAAGAPGGVEGFFGKLTRTSSYHRAAFARRGR